METDTVQSMAQLPHDAGHERDEEEIFASGTERPDIRSMTESELADFPGSKMSNNYTIKNGS